MNTPSKGVRFDARARLAASAWSLLEANDTGDYTKPSSGQYPHQWNWDSAVIAIALAKRDPQRALTEIRSLLAGQWANGMVPHIVFHDPTAPYFPDAGFWQTHNRHPEGLATSGITQPPVVATALRSIVERHGESPEVGTFIRQHLPALVRWHRWFHTERSIDGTAIAVSLHPWESGTDDSPRWLDVMGRITPDFEVTYTRADTTHVDASQRPTNADYERYIHLVDAQRRNDWDTEKALTHLPFAVHDVLTNAILLRADADLLWIAQQLGCDSPELGELRSHHKHALERFDASFWNERRGLYFDYDLRSGSAIEVNTYATFLPMWAGIASKEQARRLVEEHLCNPEEYWSELGEGYMVTTCAKNEPEWSPVRYWRGPIWVLSNWFLHGALRNYGYDDRASRVCDDVLALVEREGFVEYYNAETGNGCGARAFSWSAALVLDLLDQSS